MPSRKVSMRASMANQTSHLGIMGGLAKGRTSGASGNRATNKLVIPRGAAKGLAYMQMHGILSRNPQSGGVGKVVKSKPCNCKGLGKTEVEGDLGGGDLGGGELGSGPAVGYRCADAYAKLNDTIDGVEGIDDWGGCSTPSCWVDWTMGAEPFPPPAVLNWGTGVGGGAAAFLGDGSKHLSTTPTTCGTISGEHLCLNTFWATPAAAPLGPQTFVSACYKNPLTCPAGQGRSAETAACGVCPAGQFSSSNDATCTKCSAGQISNAGDQACTACSAGQISNAGDATCTACPAGQFSNAGDATCTKCSAGSFSNAGDATCTACSAGQISNAGDATCTDCSAGFKCPNPDATPIPCPSGTFSAGGAWYCLPCDKGTYSSGARNTKCTPCTAGEYSDTTGATTCAPCPIGTYAEGTPAVSCTDCPNGTTVDDNGFYKEKGATTCLDNESGSCRGWAGAGGAAPAGSATQGYFCCASGNDGLFNLSDTPDCSGIGDGRDGGGNPGWVNSNLCRLTGPIAPGACSKPSCNAALGCSSLKDGPWQPGNAQLRPPSCASKIDPEPGCVSGNCPATSCYSLYNGDCQPNPNQTIPSPAMLGCSSLDGDGETYVPGGKNAECTPAMVTQTGSGCTQDGKTCPATACYWQGGGGTSAAGPPSCKLNPYLP